MHALKITFKLVHVRHLPPSTRIGSLGVHVCVRVYVHVYGWIESQPPVRCCRWMCVYDGDRLYCIYIHTCLYICIHVCMYGTYKQYIHLCGYVCIYGTWLMWVAILFAMEGFSPTISTLTELLFSLLPPCVCMDALYICILLTLHVDY